ncbi:Conserved_hypothetical protein [Hexamita inflata]|uniref:Uncharacterized protein n=2 Tax=Hexamita inflata TaxID=28002 RepID=A0AA86QHC2_9EUKA|nr:Conserved hypothetical protein [Hexamita inflata]
MLVLSFILGAQGHGIHNMTYQGRFECWLTLRNPVLSSRNQCMLQDENIDLDNHVFNIVQLGSNHEMLNSPHKVACAWASIILVNTTLSNAHIIINTSLTVDNFCSFAYIAPIILLNNSRLINVTIQGEIQANNITNSALMQPVLYTLDSALINISFAEFRSNHSESLAIELYSTPLSTIPPLRHVPFQTLTHKFSLFAEYPELTKYKALTCLQNQINYNEHQPELGIDENTILTKNNTYFFCRNCSCTKCVAVFEKRCVDSCPGDLVLNGQHCVEKGSFKERKQKIYPGYHDDNYHFIYDPEIEEELEQNPQIPYPHCPENTFLYLPTKKCIRKCPRNFEEFAGVCAACEPGTTSNGSKCEIMTCSHRKVLINDTCTHICPLGYFKWKSICVKRCPGVLVGFNGYCQPACPPPMVNESFVCKYYCERSYRFEESCVDRCPGLMEVDVTHKVCEYSLNIEDVFYCKRLKLPTEPYDPCRQYHDIFNVAMPHCNYPYYKFNGVCVLKCPESTLIDRLTGECVQACPSSLIQFKNFCTSICPGGQVNLSGKCVNQCKKYEDYYDGQCVNICPEGRLPFDGRCERCDNNVIISYGQVKVCQQKCPLNQATFSSNICHTLPPCPGRYLQNDLCVDQCGFGFYQDSVSRVCLTSCPLNTLIDPTFRRCLSRCPPNYFKQNQFCVKNCSNSMILNPLINECVVNCSPFLFSNGICVQKCAENQVVLEGECAEKCGIQHFKQGKECVRECSEDKVAYKGVCINIEELFDNIQLLNEMQAMCAYYNDVSKEQCTEQIQKTQFHFNHTVIIKRCPQGYYSYEQQCFVNCPSDLYGDILNSACVKKCPPFTYTHQQYKLCLKSCSEGFYITEDNQCVEQCSVGVADNIIMRCAQNCTEGFVDLKNHVCAIKCKNANYQRQCVDQCPTNFYADLSGLCVQICPKPLVGDQYTQKCQLQCSPGLYEQDNYCVKLCDKYIDIHNHKCLSKCDGIQTIVGQTRICLHDKIDVNNLIPHFSPYKQQSFKQWVTFWLIIWGIVFIIACFLRK